MGVIAPPLRGTILAFEEGLRLSGRRCSPQAHLSIEMGGDTPFTGRWTFWVLTVLGRYTIDRSLFPHQPYGATKFERSIIPPEWAKFGKIVP